jgi:hypothetical protein
MGMVRLLGAPAGASPVGIFVWANAGDAAKIAIEQTAGSKPVFAILIPFLTDPDVRAPVGTARGTNV